jgi:hypothetical protein
MKRSLLWLLAMLLIPAQPVFSKEIAGIKLPEQVEWRGQPLVLNGAGLVTHMFSHLFVGALYLPERQEPAARAMDLPGLKRIRLHILYRQLSANDLRTLLQRSLERNYPPHQVERLGKQFQRLTSKLDVVRRGDILEIDVRPRRGIRLRVNERTMGEIRDRETAQAMLKVWFGQYPANRTLKLAMLGGDYD